MQGGMMTGYDPSKAQSRRAAVRMAQNARQGPVPPLIPAAAAPTTDATTTTANTANTTATGASVSAADATINSRGPLSPVAARSLTADTSNRRASPTPTPPVTDDGKASRVLDFLWLGGVTDAFDKQFLLKNNIKTILNVSSDSYGTDFQDRLGIRVVHVPMRDESTFPIDSLFQQCFTVMDDVRADYYRDLHALDQEAEKREILLGGYPRVTAQYGLVPVTATGSGADLSGGNGAAVHSRRQRLRGLRRWTPTQSTEDLPAMAPGTPHSNATRSPGSITQTASQPRKERLLLSPTASAAAAPATDGTGAGGSPSPGRPFEVTNTTSGRPSAPRLYHHHHHHTASPLTTIAAPQLPASLTTLTPASPSKQSRRGSADYGSPSSPATPNPALPESIPLPEKAFPARMLIHCQKGRSRSATVAAAYLMTMSGWSVVQTLEYLTRCRRVVDPNIGFIDRLRRLQDNLGSRLRTERVKEQALCLLYLHPAWTADMVMAVMQCSVGSVMRVADTHGNNSNTNNNTSNKDTPLPGKKDVPFVRQGSSSDEGGLTSETGKGVTTTDDEAVSTTTNTSTAATKNAKADPDATTVAMDDAPLPTAATANTTAPLATATPSAALTAITATAATAASAAAATTSTSSSCQSTPQQQQQQQRRLVTVFFCCNEAARRAVTLYKHGYFAQLAEDPPAAAFPRHLHGHHHHGQKHHHHGQKLHHHLPRPHRKSPKTPSTSTSTATTSLASTTTTSIASTQFSSTPGGERRNSGSGSGGAGGGDNGSKCGGSTGHAQTRKLTPSSCRVKACNAAPAGEGAEGPTQKKKIKIFVVEKN